MPICKHCEREFEDRRELENHYDPIKTVQQDPLVLLLDLPDGCTPGRWEAAKAFAEAMGQVKQKYPDRKFQYIHFTEDGHGNVESMLAMAE